MSAWETVATVSHEAWAVMIRDLLEQEGHEVMLAPSGIGSAYFGSAGPWRVLVLGPEADRARRFVAEQFPEGF